MTYDSGLSAPHHVVIEERKSLTVSGVEDVERFDENTIVHSNTVQTVLYKLISIQQFSEYFPRQIRS